MRYYGSIIIFNKYFDKILLIEYEKNKFMLPCIENKNNINININTLILLNDFLYKKNIYISYDTFYILNSDKSIFYMICSLQDVEKNIYFDDSEYFDVKFVSLEYIINNNLLDKNILDNIITINKNNINVYITKYIKINADYYIIRKHILYYLRNLKYKSTSSDIYIYVKNLLNNVSTYNITENDCIISMIFDTTNRIIYEDGYYFSKFRHNKSLLNEFIIENRFSFLSYEIACKNIYYLLIYNRFNEYIFSDNLYTNNLQFILINSLDPKITKQIYMKYTTYYVIDIKQCILDNILCYIVNDNIIITLGNNGILLSKYILGYYSISHN